MRIQHLVLLAFSFLVLAGCTPKEKQIERRVLRMAETAELATVEYKVRKIVKTNDEKWYSVGDRKILFSATAYLKAGVDLEGFTADKVSISGDDISVTLPHAKLLSFNMPIEETSTVFESYGFFRSRFSAEEQNHILELGERDIRRDIPNLGILQDAEQNARDLFTVMLSQMGFKNITIIFEED